MSTKKRIEQALLGIGQAQFETLCNELLRHRDKLHITDYGSVEGAEKTRSGTPDAYAP